MGWINFGCVFTQHYGNYMIITWSTSFGYNFASVIELCFSFGWWLQSSFILLIIHSSYPNYLISSLKQWHSFLTKSSMLLYESIFLAQPFLAMYTFQAFYIIVSVTKPHNMYLSSSDLINTNFENLFQNRAIGPLGSFCETFSWKSTTLVKIVHQINSSFSFGVPSFLLVVWNEFFKSSFFTPTTLVLHTTSSLLQ